MVRVKGHYRRAKSGKQIWVRGYNRSRGGITKIPIRTENPSIRVTSAEYHGDTKTSSIAIVDEDTDKTIFVMKEVPMKVEQIQVDEHGDIGVGIKAKTKTKEDVTAVVVTPKDV